MRKRFLIPLICLMPCIAFAGDPTVPVRDVMDATTNNWEEGDHAFQDLFDEARLTHLYSRDFVARYRAAAKVPAYDEGSSPFDYDVIVSGQDGCPLKETAIVVKGETKGVTQVDATFKNMTCAGTEPEYQNVTTVQFLVVAEAGREVIDDILTEGDGKFVSLKEVMAQIAAGG